MSDDAQLSGISKGHALLSATWAVVCVYGIFVFAHIASNQPIPDGILLGSVIAGVVTLANLAVGKKVRG